MIRNDWISAFRLPVSSPWITACLMTLMVLVSRLGWAQTAPEESETPTATQIFDPMISARDKQIAAIQPRPFSKEGRGELALGIGTIANDVFIVYLPVTIRGGYHFREWLSVEVSAAFMGCFGSDSGPRHERAAAQHCARILTQTYRALQNQNTDLTQVRAVVIQEYQVARFAINPIWSPFSSKFSLANDAIVHFDLNLSAGLGVLIVEALKDTALGKYTLGASFEGNLGLGLRFIFNDVAGLRLDFREYLYGKQQGHGLGMASELTLSVSFLL